MEIKEIIERWSNTGLLENMPRKENAAICLEAQRRYNDTLPDDLAQFKRVSIPILRRALAESVAFRRNSFTNYFEQNTGHKEIYFFKSKFKFDSSGDLQNEATECARFAKDLCQELDEVFSDQYGKFIVFHGLTASDNDGSIGLLYSLT